MCIVNPLSINDYSMNITILTLQIVPWACSSKVCSLCFISSNTDWCRAQWLRGKASDSRLIGPRFKSCGVKTLGKFFTLNCSSSLSCINEYLAIDSGGYVYEQSSRINSSIWLDVSQRS